MPNHISVIIPSYRNPEYLNLCLHSLYDNQTTNPEIIVVLDGFVEESEHVVNKYPGLNVIPLEENKGVQYAHNIGVIHATNEAILLLNDDNVAPKQWDRRLLDVYNPQWVISPNQCEPEPSIFKDFIINDYGKSVEDFRYEDFIHHEWLMRNEDSWSAWGQTWPVFMSKKWYMIIGGCDENYPNGAVADHDVFVKLEMAGLEFRRYMSCTFYHFASASVKKSPEMIKQQQEKEALSHEYFKWKWGTYTRFGQYNSHLPEDRKLRGINL